VNLFPEGGGAPSCSTSCAFICSITAFGLITSECLGRKQKSQLPKPGKDPKFRPISLLSATGNLFETLILRTIRKHTEERNLLNTSLFGFECIIVRHFSVWRWRITLPKISTITCWRLLCDWISTKPPIQHATPAYCMNGQN
jgi:hypothetical protein